MSLTDDNKDLRDSLSRTGSTNTTAQTQSGLDGLSTDMMTHITVLNDLPKFKGNPKEGDLHFKHGVDCRTFFRSLENYFRQNNIPEDQKGAILYSKIDKEVGDACRLATSFATTNATFSEIKQGMLEFYPIQ